MNTAAYKPRVGLFWWVRRRSYLVFVLRELSAVFVAWFVGYLLALVWTVSSGPGEYQAFLAWSARPWVLVVNVVAFAFVLLHAVTWFNLAPRAMDIRVGRVRVPAVAVLAAHYAAWAVVSAVVAWLVLR